MSNVHFLEYSSLPRLFRASQARKFDKKIFEYENSIYNYGELKTPQTLEHLYWFLAKAPEANIFDNFISKYYTALQTESPSIIDTAVELANLNDDLYLKNEQFLLLKFQQEYCDQIYGNAKAEAKLNAIKKLRKFFIDNNNCSKLLNNQAIANNISAESIIIIANKSAELAKQILANPVLKAKFNVGSYNKIGLLANFPNSLYIVAAIVEDSQMMSAYFENKFKIKLATYRQATVEILTRHIIHKIEAKLQHEPNNKNLHTRLVKELAFLNSLSNDQPSQVKLSLSHLLPYADEEINAVFNHRQAINSSFTTNVAFDTKINDANQLIQTLCTTDNRLSDATVKAYKAAKSDLSDALQLTQTINNVNDANLLSSANSTKMLVALQPVLALTKINELLNVMLKLIDSSSWRDNDASSRVPNYYEKIKLLMMQSLNTIADKQLKQDITNMVVGLSNSIWTADSFIKNCTNEKSKILTIIKQLNKVLDNNLAVFYQNIKLLDSKTSSNLINHLFDPAKKLATKDTCKQNLQDLLTLQAPQFTDLLSPDNIINMYSLLREDDDDKLFCELTDYLLQQNKQVFITVLKQALLVTADRTNVPEADLTNATLPTDFSTYFANKLPTMLQNTAILGHADICKLIYSDFAISNELFNGHLSYLTPYQQFLLNNYHWLANKQFLRILAHNSGVLNQDKQFLLNNKKYSYLLSKLNTAISSVLRQDEITDLQEHLDLITLLSQGAIRNVVKIDSNELLAWAHKILLHNGCVLPEYKQTLIANVIFDAAWFKLLQKQANQDKQTSAKLKQLFDIPGEISLQTKLQRDLDEINRAWFFKKSKTISYLKQKISFLDSSIEPTLEQEKLCEIIANNEQLWSLIVPKKRWSFFNTNNQSYINEINLFAKSKAFKQKLTQIGLIEANDIANEISSTRSASLTDSAISTESYESNGETIENTGIIDATCHTHLSIVEHNSPTSQPQNQLAVQIEYCSSALILATVNISQAPEPSSPLKTKGKENNPIDHNTTCDTMIITPEKTKEATSPKVNVPGTPPKTKDLLAKRRKQFAGTVNNKKSAAAESNSSGVSYSLRPRAQKANSAAAGAHQTYKP